MNYSTIRLSKEVVFMKIKDSLANLLGNFKP